MEACLCRLRLDLSFHESSLPLFLHVPQAPQDGWTVPGACYEQDEELLRRLRSVEVELVHNSCVLLAMPLAANIHARIQAV